MPTPFKICVSITIEGNEIWLGKALDRALRMQHKPTVTTHWNQVINKGAFSWNEKFMIMIIRVVIYKIVLCITGNIFLMKYFVYKVTWQLSNPFSLFIFIIKIHEPGIPEWYSNCLCISKVFVFGSYNCFLMNNIELQKVLSIWKINIFMSP